ncbi:MAG: heavy metal-binding domain-containing protein [Candidatus Hydrogenedentota bacterium]|nr:MAG: heavy metal-binding domain-containing protein [Candidatus Hydrogenedentota bacterium]
MEQLIIFIVLVALGYLAGTMAESRHYRSIEDRERKLLNLPAVTIKNALDENAQITRAELVSGSVVVSLDYFKRVLAALRNLVGGEIGSYETLIDRARREAILRMKESAEGADIILNVRIETSSIGKSANDRKAIGSVEALAYGTAVTLRKQS